MAGDRIKELSEDTKIYQIKRKDVIPYISRISIFILNHKNDEKHADDIERSLRDYNIEIKRDILEFDSRYNDDINVFDEVTYMVIIVSHDFLHDWGLLEILLNNYNLKGVNNNIIPLIVEDILYEPVNKFNIIKDLKKYSKEFAKEYCVEEGYDDAPKELEKMQRIIEMTKKFLEFSLNKDKKSNKLCYQRLIKYIESDTGVDLKNNKNTVVKKEDAEMNGRNRVTNNFYGTINGLQMQQENKVAIQNQTVGQSDFDYANIQKIVEEIKKYDSMLDNEYNDDADKVRDILSDVTKLVEKKEEPQKIKNALMVLKDLSIGISGSLIASGIVDMITKLNL